MAALLQRKNGFSLVEILVAVGIIATVFLVGVTQYREYSRRQGLENVVKLTVSKIREAQNLANAGTKPAICVDEDLILESIRFAIATDSNPPRYRITASCPPRRPAIQDWKQFPVGYIVTTTNSGRVDFLPVGQGTLLSTDMTITIIDQNTLSEGVITITPLGKIDYTLTI